MGRLTIAGLAALLVLSACGTNHGPPADILERLHQWQQTWATDDAISAIMAQNMDASIDPCADFHTYACGGWTPHSEWSGPGSGLQNPVHQMLARIWWMMQEAAPPEEKSEAVAAGPLKPEVEHLREVLALCTQDAPSSQHGVLPMQPLVERIDSISDTDSLMAAIAMLHAYGIDVFFRISVSPSTVEPSRNALYLSPGGLGLKYRAIYGGGAPEYLAMREAYQSWIHGSIRQFERSPDRQVEVARVMDLEQYLANALPDAGSIDPAAYHPTDKQRLEEMTGLPWGAYFREIGVPDDAILSVADLDYFRQLGALLQRWPGTGVESYMVWHLYYETAAYLPKKRYGSVGGYGRCVASAIAILGQELERQYIARYKPEADRRVASDVWEAIHDQMRRQLEDTRWLGGAGREALLLKLSAVDVEIGFPDQWPPAPAVELAADGLYANAIAGHKRVFDYAIRQLSAPVERQWWTSSIFQTAAVYDLHRNRITLPLTNLAPPQLGVHLPDELTFAGLGMVAAHELAHGFDSRGRRFDGHGRLLESQPAGMAEAFAEREKCLRPLFQRFQRAPSYYSSFSASTVEVLPLDVEKTQDEIFADVVGVTTAYRAYATRRAGRASQRKIAGVDGDQLFFLAYAQNWCGRSKPAVERFVEAEDAHAPNHARVNGVLALIPEFSTAFGCAAGSPMRVEGSCDLF